jgi:hypothetical protein
MLAKLKSFFAAKSAGDSSDSSDAPETRDGHGSRRR